MAINIAKADITHVEFCISSISFMRFIIIQTLIRQIKFYIIKAETLLLLCFIDID